MEYLIAVSYLAEHRAAEVLATVHHTQRDWIAELQDAVYITCDAHGKLRFHRQPCAEHNAVRCRDTWPMLVDMLEAAIGEQAQSLEACLRNISIAAPLTNHLTATLGPSCSVIIVFVRYSTSDKILPRLSAFGGIVSQMLLSPALEMQLRDARDQQLTLR